MQRDDGAGTNNFLLGLTRKEGTIPALDEPHHEATGGTAHYAMLAHNEMTPLCLPFLALSGLHMKGLPSPLIP